jgi:hypothetical protein
MCTGRILLKKCHASWETAGLRCDWKALEEEVATGGTASSEDMEEKPVGCRERPKGIQQD